MDPNTLIASLQEAVPGAVVEGAGRADEVSIEMRGSGIVNLSRFAAGAATADLGGMSTLVVAPSQTLAMLPQAVQAREAIL